MSIKQIKTLDGKITFEYEYDGEQFTIVKHEPANFEVFIDGISYSVEESLPNCFKAIDLYRKICDVFAEVLYDDEDDDDEDTCDAVPFGMDILMGESYRYSEENRGW